MALKISVRKDTEVPRPSASGKANEDLEALKAKMADLPAGMVLEMEADKGRSVRGIKALVTRAAREQKTAWRHWHMGNKVYAQPAARRRVRRRKRASR